MDDILLTGNDLEFVNSKEGYLDKKIKEKTSMKLLTYWASRSIEIDQDT